MVEGRAPDVLESWFLTSSERNNEFSLLDRRRSDGLAWSSGNQVETLVHGAVYFRSLLEAIRELGKGDQLYFTDWRGDPDQHLADDPGSEIGAVLAAAAKRGVTVKGLLWRSHMDRLGFSAKENRHLGQLVNAAGGEVLLDQRVRLGGSHHQKLIVIRHAERTERDVAFVGGSLVPRGPNESLLRLWSSKAKRVLDRAGGNLVVARQTGENRQAGRVGGRPSRWPEIVRSQVKHRARTGHP